jgi:hypothetical protein
MHPSLPEGIRINLEEVLLENRNLFERNTAQFIMIRVASCSVRAGNALDKMTVVCIQFGPSVCLFPNHTDSEERNSSWSTNSNSLPYFAHQNRRGANQTKIKRRLCDFQSSPSVYFSLVFRIVDDFCEGQQLG